MIISNKKNRKGRHDVNNLFNITFFIWLLSYTKAGLTDKKIDVIKKNQLLLPYDAVSVHYSFLNSMFGLRFRCYPILLKKK